MTAGVDGPSASDGDAPPLAVSIRFETPDDERGIREVELAAFSGPEEAEIVDRIRADAPDGWRSLVAVGADGRIVGHLLHDAPAPSRTKTAASWRPCWRSARSPWTRRSSGGASGAR